MASWKARFAHYGPDPVLGDIFPSLWSPTEAQLQILHCPSVYSYFYFTWNLGHLHLQFEMVKSPTTKMRWENKCRVPIWPHYLNYWLLFSLCYPIAHSPTNSLFPPRSEPWSLSQPRLHKQRGYLTSGISLLWQALWARTPSHTALNCFSLCWNQKSWGRTCY